MAGLSLVTAIYCLSSIKRQRGIPLIDTLLSNQITCEPSLTKVREHWPEEKKVHIPPIPQHRQL